jgi:hypothetical protein
MTERRRHHLRDRGSASVWAVAGVAVIMTVFLVGLHLGAAVIARHRAEAAADLAALAAAARAVEGAEPACRRAREVATASGGTRWWRSTSRSRSRCRAFHPRRAGPEPARSRKPLSPRANRRAWEARHRTNEGPIARSAPDPVAGRRVPR